MSKKIMVIMLALTLALSGAAVAAELSGTVKEVKDKTVTIEIKKGKASDLSAGDRVKVEVKSDDKKKAPKKGGGMLMGC